MIRVENLSKTFAVKKRGGFSFSSKAKSAVPSVITALDDVSFTLNDGEITGLLGLNGAGKSTLMRLIYGLLQPSAGDVWINEHQVSTHPNAARQQLGVLPDDTGLYKRLTARENIRYFGELQEQHWKTLLTNSLPGWEWRQLRNVAQKAFRWVSA